MAVGHHIFADVLEPVLLRYLKPPQVSATTVQSTYTAP